MPRMNSSPVRWYHSVAVKSCAIAFVATHIPLLGLIAFLVARPDALSPLNVFLLALAFTLLATAFVVGVLWNMFQPLRQAADGLNDYMTRGQVMRLSAAGEDEVARLVQVLVRALAHLDRGRTALLQGTAATVNDLAREAGVQEANNRRWYALIEVDQWELLDRESSVEHMLQVHEALGEALDQLLWPGEMVLPWGRGRFLAILGGAGADVIDRLRPVCKRIPMEHGEYTATAAIDAHSLSTRASPAALQRLDHKLFYLRTEGRQAVVA
jgi:hypothetical protein